MSVVLVLGAGGHGKVVADILICQGLQVLGFLDDNPSTWGSTRLGLPVLGPIEKYAELSPSGLALGIGSNAARRAIVERLSARAAPSWLTAIHPRATVAASAKLGAGVVIAAGAVINADASVADGVIVNTGAIVEHDCVVEAFAHVAPGARLTGGVRVGEGALIGAGATVTPLRTVGAWSVVGAGALVSRDIPASVTAKGVPARW